MTSDKRRILITGASGSLGQQLAYEFSRSGIKPVAHVRSGSDTSFIDSLGLEKRLADLRNREELERLVTGMEVVIHTAAWVDFRRDKATQFAGINTFGATGLYRAAAKAGVKRFVHVSTVAAVGATPRTTSENIIQPKRLVNESHAFNLGHLRIPYILSKHAAEVELASLAESSDTELVTVNPSIIIAPSRSGDDRARALRLFNRVVVPDLRNWVNLVDVRDVAPGVIAALEHGRPGERYILAGDNITAQEIVLAVSAILGKAPPLVRPPRALLDVAARLWVMLVRLTGRHKISFYPDLVKLIDFDWAFSSMKARRELGFRPRSIHTTLDDLLNDGFIDSYAKPASG